MAAAPAIGDASLVAECSCGTTVMVSPGNLRSGNTINCGCVLKNAYLVDGVPATQHSLYKTWSHMKERCNNSTHSEYANYGGRGIVVCSQWQNSFATFVADMGPKPTGDYSIDRKDNEGNYEPSNCRWATRQEQNLNKRPRGTA